MGTDSVKLFNKAVADQILAMEQAPFVQFLEENINVLRNKECTFSLILFELEQNGGSVSDAIRRLLSGEQTFTEMKAEVAQDFCCSPEHVYQMLKSVDDHSDD